ncbi:hypothetical protein QA641_09005 [Bradyrhizobium sp. CB1650]|uniref:hypothetical protein n=1 Tax=Bradyrhizobium sp. CB1650 TaxID=3039153 RepID=UPI002434BBC7|nr:hypothetical protein [Bradyrhizobium sp. CB1650]WGD54022.1 hypothetical protein QA641_09005 [Bradyrhizobium sp. CB1650]
MADRKDRKAGGNAGFFVGRDAWFGDDQFTVTEPNDMVFLDYFFKRVADAAPELPERPGLIRRLFGWMTGAGLRPLVIPGRDEVASPE